MCVNSDAPLPDQQTGIQLQGWQGSKCIAGSLSPVGMAIHDSCAAQAVAGSY